ncbi:MAG: MFS transporter [Pseudomonadota bacterium]
MSRSTSSPPPSSQRTLTLVLLITGAVLGLAGTDLVLPAIPTLPGELGGDAGSAQFVLAAYALGIGVGLLVFGALAARYSVATLLVGGSGVFALASAAAAFAPDITSLVALRFLQGIASAAAPVFAPGIIRALFDEAAALRVIGVFGSIESLTPALAPIAGVGLLGLAGWQASFVVLAILAAVLALGLKVLSGVIPALPPANGQRSYRHLARLPEYRRQVLGHALSLGGLLTFVFGAPTVIVNDLGGTLRDFVIMQVCGITMFIIAANSAASLVRRFGSETMILFGSTLSAAGIVAILIYAMSGGRELPWLIGLFLFFNVGFGFRGPPGFYAAIVASEGDDARGSAVLVLSIMVTAAGGTALVAPWISGGLVPLALAAAGLSVLSPLALILLPRQSVATEAS